MHNGQKETGWLASGINKAKKSKWKKLRKEQKCICENI